jgi:hypothetical protein
MKTPSCEIQYNSIIDMLHLQMDELLEYLPIYNLIFDIPKLAIPLILPDSMF